MEKVKCVICGKEIENPNGFAPEIIGNNPEPVYSVGRCCDRCNKDYVIPARIAVAEIVKSAVAVDMADEVLA